MIALYRHGSILCFSLWDRELLWEHSLISIIPSARKNSIIRLLTPRPRYSSFVVHFCQVVGENIVVSVSNSSDIHYLVVLERNGVVIFSSELNDCIIASCCSSCRSYLVLGCSKGSVYRADLAKMRSLSDMSSSISECLIGYSVSEGDSIIDLQVIPDLQYPLVCAVTSNYLFYALDSNTPWSFTRVESSFGEPREEDSPQIIALRYPFLIFSSEMQLVDIVEDNNNVDIVLGDALDVPSITPLSCQSFIAKNGLLFQFGSTGTRSTEKALIGNIVDSKQFTFYRAVEAESLSMYLKDYPDPESIVHISVEDVVEDTCEGFVVDHASEVISRSLLLDVHRVRCPSFQVNCALYQNDSLQIQTSLGGGSRSMVFSMLQTGDYFTRNDDDIVYDLLISCGALLPLNPPFDSRDKDISVFVSLLRWDPGSLQRLILSKTEDGYVLVDPRDLFDTICQVLKMCKTQLNTFQLESKPDKSLVMKVSQISRLVESSKMILRTLKTRLPSIEGKPHPSTIKLDNELKNGDCLTTYATYLKFFCQYGTSFWDRYLALIDVTPVGFETSDRIFFRNVLSKDLVDVYPPRDFQELHSILKKAFDPEVDAINLSSLLYYLTLESSLLSEETRERKRGKKESKISFSNISDRFLQFLPLDPVLRNTVFSLFKMDRDVHGADSFILRPDVGVVFPEIILDLFREQESDCLSGYIRKLQRIEGSQADSIMEWILRAYIQTGDLLRAWRFSESSGNERIFFRLLLIDDHFESQRRELLKSKHLGNVAEDRLIEYCAEEGFFDFLVLLLTRKRRIVEAHGVSHSGQAQVKEEVERLVREELKNLPLPVQQLARRPEVPTMESPMTPSIANVADAALFRSFTRSKRIVEAIRAGEQSDPFTRPITVYQSPTLPRSAYRAKEVIEMEKTPQLSVMTEKVKVFPRHRDSHASYIPSRLSVHVSEMPQSAQRVERGRAPEPATPPSPPALPTPPSTLPINPSLLRTESSPSPSPSTPQMTLRSGRKIKSYR